MRIFVFIAVIIFAANSAFAQNSGTCGDNATWEYDESTKTLTFSGTGMIYNYLNEEDDNAPWYKKYQSEAQYIVINSGITQIHIGTFYAFTNVKNATIPNSVISIGKVAFAYVNNIEYYGSAEGSPWGAYCRNGYFDGDFIYSDNTKKELLKYVGQDTEVTIPDGVTSIGAGALTRYRLTPVISYTIPESVTSIGNTFGANEKLESIYLNNDPAKLEWMNYEYEFSRTTSPIKLYVLPQYFDIWNEKFGNFRAHATFVMEGVEYEQGGVTYVLSDGIAVVTGYTSDLPDELVIPETITKDGVDYNVTIIGINAFKNCENLTSVIIPKSVKSINSNAFYQCSKLTSITIPEGVKTIGNHAFENCKNLTSVIIPKSVKSIGKRAFAYCYNITSTIIIPESVTSIGEEVFWYTGINTQWYWYLHPDLFDNKIFYGNKIYQIHVPAEYLEEFNEKFNKKYDDDKHFTFIGDIINIGNENITIPAQTYTGEALTPVVKDGDKTLIEGEDYTITLPEGGCINAGEYTVTLTAKNPLYYKSAEKTFVINPAPVQIEDTETATDDITLSSVKIWSFNKTIFVENAAQEIVIVDMSGRIVKTIKPESSRTEIQLEKSGVYIVKIGIKTQKVSL